MQFYSQTQYLAMCVGGGGGGVRSRSRSGRLEGVSFYKRFYHAQFHSHLKKTSAKNTLPKYNCAIRPL